MTMGLFALTEIILDKKRINPYFDKYQYKAVFNLPGINYFRDICTIEKFESRLNSKVSRYENRYHGHRTLHTIKNLVSLEGENHIDKFYEFITWRSNNKQSSQLKCVIKYSTLEVYTVELEKLLELVDGLAKLGVEHTVYKSYILEKYERGVIYHIEPKHKFRIFLKGTKLNRQDTKKFDDFIKVYKLSLAPSLKNYVHNVINYDGHRTHFSYQNLIITTTNYIDIDDEQYVTLLSLMYPDLIRKVCKIEKR